MVRERMGSLRKERQVMVATRLKHKGRVVDSGSRSDQWIKDGRETETEARTVLVQDEAGRSGPQTRPREGPQRGNWWRMLGNTDPTPSLTRFNFICSNTDPT